MFLSAFNVQRSEFTTLNLESNDLKSMSLLQTTPTSSVEDVRRFFETFAHLNVERHGKADRLLKYRVKLLKKYAGLKYSDDVLDIGCGNGHHLFALDGYMRTGTGIDIATGMIETAHRTLPARAATGYRFLVDDAHTLSQIPDDSADVVFCVGALEHMVDKQSVLSATRRVLKRKGRFVCLTLNDRFVWYRKLAPSLGYETRHLTTDRRLDKAEAFELMKSAGFRCSRVSYWTFIPRGDMPPRYARICQLLDAAGRLAFTEHLRGGLVLYGENW